MAATAGVQVNFSLGRDRLARGLDPLAPLRDVVRALQSIDKEISFKYQARAINKAAKVGMDALRSQVGQIGQVTGNLAESVSKRSRTYDNNKRNLPVTVAVVGFRRPTNAPSQKMATPAFSGGGVLKGPNRAYHSHLVEYGTRSRTPGISTRKRVNRRRVIFNGRIRTFADRLREPTGRSRRIMSSGFAKDANAAARKGKRREFTGRGQYPIDFIATGSVRGAPAQRPLEKAYYRAKPRMESILNVEMRKALELAIKAMNKKWGITE